MMRLLGVIPLLGNLMSDFKGQWFSMWCKTRISLSFRPKRSSVDHSLAIKSLMSLAPTKSFSTSSKLLGYWYGISVGVRRHFSISRISSWPRIFIFPVSTQGDSLVCSYRVKNLVGCSPFWYRTMSHGDRFPMELSFVGAEGYDKV